MPRERHVLLPHSEFDAPSLSSHVQMLHGMVDPIPYGQLNQVRHPIPIGLSAPSAGGLGLPLRAPGVSVAQGPEGGHGAGEDAGRLLRHQLQHAPRFNVAVLRWQVGYFSLL